VTDKELDALLKSAQAPLESETFRQNLPEQVLSRAGRFHRKRRLNEPSLPGARAQASAFAPMRLVDALAAHFRAATYGVGISAVFIAILLGLIFRPGSGPRITDTQLAEARKYFTEIRQLFPNQLRGIVLKNHNPSVMLSETSDVPDSEPVLLHVASPAGRSSFVVLNGQEFSFAGKRYEVLLDHRGEVLVIGPDIAWSSLNPKQPHQPVKIAARPLKITS